MELKFSHVGKETFLPWKFIFPPLEILFSKAGKFLENSQEDPLRRFCRLAYKHIPLED